MSLGSASRGVRTGTFSVSKVKCYCYEYPTLTLLYFFGARAATFAIEMDPFPPPMLNRLAASNGSGEWKYQLNLSTPRGPATGRRSEVRPEVGLPKAPLERED